MKNALLETHQKITEEFQPFVEKLQEQFKGNFPILKESWELDTPVVEKITVYEALHLPLEMTEAIQHMKASIHCENMTETGFLYTVTNQMEKSILRKSILDLFTLRVFHLEKILETQNENITTMFIRGRKNNIEICVLANLIPLTKNSNRGEDSSEAKILDTTFALTGYVYSILHKTPQLTPPLSLP